MNASELSRALGVSEATVSRVASGHRRPSIELLAKIQNELGWDVDHQVDLLLSDPARYGREFARRMTEHVHFSELPRDQCAHGSDKDAWGHLGGPECTVLE